MGPLLEPRPSGSQGLALAFSGIIREVWKSYWSGNYILQKKGRDTAHHGQDSGTQGTQGARVSQGALGHPFLAFLGPLGPPVLPMVCWLSLLFLSTWLPLAPFPPFF